MERDREREGEREGVGVGEDFFDKLKLQSLNTMSTFPTFSKGLTKSQVII